MRCERARELFSEYIEGEVSRPLLLPLETHLEACDDCRSQLSGLRNVWQILDTTPLAEPPADFRAVVWQRIEVAEQQRAARRPWSRLLESLRPRAALAALGAAAVLLLMVATQPGRNVAASLGVPGFGRSHAPAALRLTAGAPVLSGPRVTVPISANRPVEFTVRAASPGVRVIDEDARRVSRPGEPAEVVLEIAAEPEPRVIRLTLVPGGGANEPTEVTVELPQ